jgi:hypothetical protein
MTEVRHIWSFNFYLVVPKVALCLLNRRKQYYTSDKLEEERYTQRKWKKNVKYEEKDLPNMVVKFPSSVKSVIPMCT